MERIKTSPMPEPAEKLTRVDAALIPRATYRVQLHAGFGFDAARQIVPYLAELGVSHLYVSPWTKARPGSTHGYDVVDPGVINPEIGDAAALEALNRTLAEYGMSQIVDIVPNHMGVLGAWNPWWVDLLEHGEASEHATSFDIEWHPPDPLLQGRVMLPVLEGQYGDMLKAGKLRVDLDAGTGRFELHYEDHRFPLDPREVAPLLRRVPADDDAARWLHTIAAALAALPGRQRDPDVTPGARARAAAALADQIATLLRATPQLVARVQAALDEVNCPGDATEPWAALHALLEAQAYRLAFWKAASDGINYRRFFDVNGLAALRMERPEVFARTHGLVLQGLRDGTITGLRIDHPDGLYDPESYLQRLQAEFERVQRSADPARAPRQLYLLVEKILAHHEVLPAGWPVHGDTGYHFLTLVNSLAVDCANERRIDRVHAAFIGEQLDDDTVLDLCKHGVMTHSLSSELNRLTDRLHHIAIARLESRDHTPMALRLAIRALVAAFPVYRTYITARGIGPDDEAALATASEAARRRRPLLESGPLDFLLGVLRGAAAESDPLLRREKLDFAARLQQFSSPVMAKAVEDTAFYRYNRLVSLNDVGGDPARFGISTPVFHEANLNRLATHPHAMLATSTHDTKRSEGVRVRINVLSEIPARWRLALLRWSRINDGHRSLVKGLPAPSRNDEYLLYQTLLGVWPDEGAAADDALAALRERVQAYMLKAVREAKQHTSWMSPQADYEEALGRFVGALLGRVEANPFLDEFLPLQRWLAAFGRLNTLNQTLLKFTVPGVPDIYQGCESWNLNLVDPDNRRPVEFDNLAQQLAGLRELEREAAGPPAAGHDVPLRRDERVKLALVWRALALRRRWPELFEHGDYAPCEVVGPAQLHIVAFAREHQGRQILVITSRLLARLTRLSRRAQVGGRGRDRERGPRDLSALQGGAAWRGTWVRSVQTVDGAAPVAAWRCLLSGRRFAAPADGLLDLAQVLADWPFALLVAEA